MKTANIRSRGQVYSVGNYLMTGKVLGKGHFARVEEATHRSIGKKVAIKVIDLTCIKEEYARRNLHREPRVMARLRHPCIAALYETMMHGPRLYVVMEAAGGGDLCAHVLAARGPARGLPEARARALAAQLVSAVRHMHVRGVVHRDLKMENIMLDSTKQFIKIVDFGLSNLWSAGGSLRTPCGSLEYAAPELFVDGRRYGPEVDLWSIGVIVYGMVTGGLPFTGAEGSEGRSRPQLRAAIARGFSRKQRAALAYVSAECKLFVQQLLEPNVESRMKIEEAARHRWLRRAGMRMRVHPFGAIEPKVNREIYKQISELSGSPVMDVVAQIKADPFGATAGMYNIKCHLHQLQSLPAAELLWCSGAPEPRAASPPEYRAHTAPPASAPTAIGAKPATAPPMQPALHSQKMFFNSAMQRVHQQNEMARAKAAESTRRAENKEPPRTPGRPSDPLRQLREEVERSRAPPSPRHAARPLASSYAVKKPIYKIYDNGDCGLDPRLPSIDEHSNTDLKDTKNPRRPRAPPRRPEREDERRLAAHPNRFGDGKRADFFRRAGDCLQNWRTGGVIATPPAKILLQSNATTIKRASLGNIVSPHSSSNSHCKSERAMPVGWYSTRSQLSKESSHLQRFRRTAPMK